MRYAELHSWARRVGRRLERDGVLRGERIGLAVERSPALVAGLTGILSTGAAFVPLDPAYPKARLERMIADAGVQRIVTDERSAERLRELFLDRTLIVVSELDADEAYDAPRSDHPEELAYVMFTSGSSGRPKGVEVSQRALSLHIDDYLTAFEVTDKDTVLQFSTVNFDAALEQMLPILTIGGRLVMRGSELWTWEALNRCLQSERVTLAYLPTGYFRQWLAELPAEAPPTLRLLTVGGEALAGAALAVWRASALGGIRLENTYGPTEATITTSAHVTCAADVASSIVPIGKSLLGRRAALLSEDGDDVPAGGIGELCIGGASLARGYLGVPALTAERFVPDPRGSAGERLYRTGDRCRRRVDGTFEFLGRRDTQVKLRGYRIELGEVETALRLCPGVTDAVISLSGEGERARLVGYMVGRASVDAVRAQLEQTLPAYMVPVAFVPLERIPLLPNGKVARKSLPDAPSAPVVDAAGAPRTAAEETLLSIWKQVLRREDLGIRDDFFALGGDSILSLQ
ncbi:MAG TPA: non-ribosomal peptide synthetase, partial [Polyangiaceae bacterium]